MRLALSAETIFLFATLSALGACRQDATAPRDPQFSAAWEALASRGIAPLVVDSDHGEALLDSVHRAHGRAATPPAPPAPAVEEPPAPPPGVPDQEVLRIVRGGLGAMRVCYKQAEQRGTIASGKAIVTFKILPVGTVDAVQVNAPAFDDARLASCVESQVKTWQFPKFEGQPMQVSYPFVFIGG